MKYEIKISEQKRPFPYVVFEDEKYNLLGEFLLAERSFRREILSATNEVDLGMSESESFTGNVFTLEITKDVCKIINNSYGAVRVRSAVISAASGWHLTKFGDKSILAGEKVDSKKLGFAMKIGGGTQVKTTSNNDTQTLISSPIAGCYMTGVGDPNGSTAKIDYAAIVTPLSNAISNATVATVVFVIEWDTAR